MAIGASLVYPTLVGAMAMGAKGASTLFAGTIFEVQSNLTFLGVPVISMTYTSSVIPIIIAVYFASILERKLKVIIPDVIKTFFVPFFTLLIVVPLTFLIIGPISSWIANWIGSGAIGIYGLSPILAGLLADKIGWTMTLQLMMVPVAFAIIMWFFIKPDNPLVKEENV